MISDKDNHLDDDAAPLDNNSTPVADDSPLDTSETPRPKRNSGRTGPTSSIGRERSSRNAISHGLCAKTLILSYEEESAWLELRNVWLAEYQNPAEDSVLYTFVVKTAQAEWYRRRAQKEYDFFLDNKNDPPMYAWPPERIKQHELVQRYLTTAERKFQRDYRMLEQHWKSHHKNQAEPPKIQNDKANSQLTPEPPSQPPTYRFYNNETGESVDCEGKEYPPPPNYVPQPIIPGIYRPKHPAYEGLPQDRKP